MPQHSIVPSVRMAQEWLGLAETVMNGPSGAAAPGGGQASGITEMLEKHISSTVPSFQVM